MLMAIDTSTSLASVALYDSRVIREHTWRVGQNHTVQLLGVMARLLEEGEVGPLTGVVVALGPGSFNGLRVGVSTAKGLAFALGLPIVGIGTLEAIAYQYADCGIAVRPVLDAGRKQACTALYVSCQLKALEEPRLVAWTQLLEEIRPPLLLCGEAPPDWEAEVRRRYGEGVVLPTPAASLRRAGYLAELGAQRLQAGGGEDVVALEPLYLRRPGITQR